MFDPESLTNVSKSAKANDEEKSKKHTLESDEEDGDDDNDKLDEDDIEGQEDDTIAFDGNITIMPFNMKEEMETGHFDSAGTYIFKKDSEIKDGWMDNIDWVKVKQTDKSADAGGDDSSSDEEPEPVDKLSTWKEMIEMMKPGETVSKALRRLGGNKKMTSAQRLKAKKQGIKQTEEELKNEQLFQNLTSLADRLIQSGYMEVYEDTYEKINYHISQSELVNKKRVLPADEDEALDMFGEQFDEKHSSVKASNEPSSKKVKFEEKPASVSDSNEVMWEFKYEDKDESEIQGPFTSSQMQQKVDNDEFPAGVYVRKVSSGGGAFYSSKRIDFDLYT